MNVEQAMTVGAALIGSTVNYHEAARILDAEVDRLRVELLKANADTERLEAQFGRMREAARAFSELNAVYRVNGRRPSEQLFKRLECARVTMQELGAE